MNCCDGWCQTCLSKQLTIDLYAYFGLYVGNIATGVALGFLPVPDDEIEDLPEWVEQVGGQFNQFRSSLCPPLSFNYRCDDLRSAVVFCWRGRDYDFDDQNTFGDISDPGFRDFNNCVNVVYNTTFFCPCVSGEGNYGLQPVVASVNTRFDG
jgi:hypothetical protein